MNCPRSVAEIIIDNTKVPVFWKDAERRYRGVNRAFLNFFGLADEGSVAGRTSEEAWLVADVGKCVASDEYVLGGGHVANEQHTIIVGGEERHIAVRKGPLLENGRITGIFGAFEDITQQARQQNEIKKLNAELKLRIADFDILMDSTRVCISKILLDDELTITWCNEAMFRTIGWSRSEYSARYDFKMRRYFSEYRDEVAKLEAAMQKALADGEPRFELFMKVPTKDGFIWAKGVGTFTDYVDGHPASLYAVYTDVTDVMEMQKKLEEVRLEAERAQMLAEENERLQKLLDNVPSGISVFRGKPGAYGVLSSNHYLCETFDIPKRISGVKKRKDLLAYMHPDDRKHGGQDVDSLFDDGAALEGIYRFRDARTKKYVWSLVRGRRVPEPNGEATVYFTYTNIDAMKKTEAELRENRRIYAKAVETAKLVLWQYDIRKHRVVMSDDQYTKYDYAKFGLKRVTENAPQSMAPYIDEADLPAFLEMYRQVELGHDASCEIWYKPAQGREPRCMRISYSVELDENGLPLRAYGMGQNITADKKVEERYQRETEALRNGNNYGMIAKGHGNLTQNTVIEDTPIDARAYDTPPDISYDKSCVQLVNMACADKESREKLAAAIDRKNLIRRYQNGETRTSVQYRRRSADGSFNWALIELNVYMMPYTGDLECFSYTYDVTEKVINDEVMGLVSDAVFDYIGLIHASTGVYEHLRKSPQVKFPELREKTDYDKCRDYVRSHFVSADEAEQYNNATSLANILSDLEKSGHHTATYMYTEDGRRLCKQMDYVWLDRESQIILLMRSDVTATYERDQKQLRAIEAAKLEADKANEAKSTFLSSMSHDLRTPLNGVLGFTDVAMREKDPLKKQDYLGKIRSSGKLLLDLVNDTLELSRIESGKMTLDPQPVEGRDFWNSVVTALRPTAELKNIRIDTDPSSYPDKLIWIDRLKVQKVVLNLLSNAIKYTPAGGTVRFSVEELVPPVNGCTRRIVVSDTGIGMSAGFLTRLYEPFAQEHRPEAANVVGTGLGLSIVKRIVDLMGGSIKVESEMNKGTSFTVNLPIPCAEAAKEAQKKTQEPQASLAGKKALLCEDNYLNREIAVLLLKDQGIEVDCAENGKEGLEKFAASEPGFYDAVLMDLRMPVMDGCEATRRIRSLDRADAPIVPIIAMTADAFEEDFQRTKEAGMNAHVTKPIDPEKLMKILRENMKLMLK
jgi:PAS domain S-box-containing protein